MPAFANSVVVGVALSVCLLCVTMAVQMWWIFPEEDDSALGAMAAMVTWTWPRQPPEERPIND